MPPPEQHPGQSATQIQSVRADQLAIRSGDLNPTSDPAELNRRDEVFERMQGIVVLVIKLAFVGFAISAIIATVVINYH
ncbi:hypothetical protein [Mesorhizobium delmotii]|uniref:Uncharacterized protein n=1 Tax=Mesorhizobium delmotii TaxID=1631247 RepID=A0A2P9API5_9HYPH|nr:hypothetical protein [Mesorhizobium delmotii]SJM33064.1 hypothetical protein BQ8482_330199 [Mesorhizobium delmotii]